MTSLPQATMPPAFAPKAASPQQADAETKASEYFAQFYSVGILENVDIQVMAQLARVAHDWDHEVLLGCALAIHAPRHGHICINLSTVHEMALPFKAGTDDEDETKLNEELANLTWPVPDKWQLKLQQSPLVRLADEQDKQAPFVLNGQDLYTARYWLYQQNLANELIRRSEVEINDIQSVEDFQKSLKELFKQPKDSKKNKIANSSPALNRQQLSVAMAALRGLTVVSGGPGMGKTWTVRNILAILYMQRELGIKAGKSLLPLQVALAAPSGKAAARMRESIMNKFDAFKEILSKSIDDPDIVESISTFLKDDLKALTIHRLLGYQVHTPTRFRHDANNPLPYDVVIVDESSMVDMAMMSRVAQAVAPGARLILLGDKHQLASVEAGTVLADLCGPISGQSMTMAPEFIKKVETLCGIPTDDTIQPNSAPPVSNCIVQYNANYRFDKDSGIGHFAKRCLDLYKSDEPNTDSVLNTFSEHKTGIDLIGHTEDGKLTPDAKAMIKSGYLTYLDRLFSGAAKGQSQIDFHMKVLEAFDTFRMLSPHRQGALGVEGLNKMAEDQLRSTLKKHGSSTRNPFYIGRPVLVRQNDYSLGLFNGDVGIVVEHIAEDGRESVQVVFADANEKVRYVSTNRLPRHQTVYAMTIHNSQGSEFTHAMVILPNKLSPVVSRELIYTGVTRASEQMTMVSSPNILSEALKKKLRRASGLRKILWG